jgi:hypothetical protein
MMDVGLEDEDRRTEAASEPAERRTPLLFALVAYVLLLGVILGSIYLAILALMSPMVLPAIRMLTQHG